MEKLALDWSTSGRKGVLDTAMTAIEMLSVDFIQGGGTKCTALTKNGVCRGDAGYTRLSNHEMNPRYCIFHNLMPLRDPLGRFIPA